MENDNKPTLIGEIMKARASNYDFTRAINEFIDNSLDTDATEIIIEFKNDDNKPEVIKISDNSTSGISDDNLSKIFSWTYNRERDDKDIGKFGTGFKSASVNLGNRITAFTYDMKKNIYLKCIADWRKMSEKNNWLPEKIIITQADYESSNNHPFKKGSTFLIDRLLLNRNPKFDESNIEKIANVYKYILETNPLLKMIIKLDDKEFDLRTKTYYHFNGCELENETKIEIFELNKTIVCDPNDLNMIATIDTSKSDIKNYITKKKRCKNGNYEINRHIFNSKNYISIGTIVFRSCFDKTMEIIADKQAEKNGPDPELPKGSVDIIRNNRIVGENITTFTAPRADGYANYIKHELNYTDKVFDDYLGISFNKTHDGHIPDNNLKYLLHYLIRDHQRIIIKNKKPSKEIDIDEDNEEEYEVKKPEDVKKLEDVKEPVIIQNNEKPKKEDKKIVVKDDKPFIPLRGYIPPLPPPPPKDEKVVKEVKPI